MHSIVRSSRAAHPGRDPMLDLWRGLALVDMAWVHLANHPIGLPAALAMGIGEHTRFAAGCLVLLSGMTVGHVFGPALREGGASARAARMRLLRRALLLVAIGRLASTAYLALDLAMRGFPGGAERMLAEGASLMIFASPGVTGGLLLLYALLLATVPLMEKFRARFGAGATMLSSLGVFVGAQSLGTIAQWPPWVFPLPHWQPLFVAGYLVAPRAGLLREHGNEAVHNWRAAVTVALVAVSTMRCAPSLGLDTDTLPFVEFRKVPLSVGELLWYAVASAFVLTWSAWTHDHSRHARHATGWIRRIGRWSLLVYVGHLLLEPPVLLLADVLQASPWARTVSLAAMAAGMNVVARSAEFVDTRSRIPHPTGRPRLRGLVPASGMVGGGVAAAAMAGILVLRAGFPATTLTPSTTGDVTKTKVGEDEFVDVLEFIAGRDPEADELRGDGVTSLEVDIEIPPGDPDPKAAFLYDGDPQDLTPDDLAADPEDMPTEY